MPENNDARDWSGRPNHWLVAHATDLPPGAALDVGCGEGADAVWLAGRGWRVTGADGSPAALERARRHAGEAGLADRTSWLQVDLVAGDPLPGGADLVTAMFVPVPDPDFDRVYGAFVAAVRPGGTLLVVGHHPAERVTGLLDAAEWRIEVAEGCEREQEQDGRTVTDTVVLARREA